MNTNPLFTVGLHELEDGPKELVAAVPNDWLGQMLKDTDVRPAGENDGELQVVLTKNGVEVLVQGKLRTVISVPCARTLDPAVYSIEPEVFLMLQPASSPAGQRTAPRDRRAPRVINKKSAKKRSGKGGAPWEEDPELSDEQAACDTYSGDRVVLDNFLREFVLLELPMVPLREDLRNKPFEANPPLPGVSEAATGASPAFPEGSSGDGREPQSKFEKPLDPRLSPLAELKAKLENKE